MRKGIGMDSLLPTSLPWSVHATAQRCVSLAEGIPPQQSSELDSAIASMAAAADMSPSTHGCIANAACVTNSSAINAELIRRRI
jgi:hypothetical protein